MISDTNHTKTNSSKEKTTIKHIVLAGGGAMGFAFYGALRESCQKEIWKQEDIETIYGTSIGTIISVFLSLGYEWNVLDDFIIKRPWQNVFKFQLPMALNVITKQGIFDRSTINVIFLPLFKGRDIPIDINLLDFYHLTKREIHFITTELNQMEIEDISYKTHPEWKVLDAVYASCCLPFLFSPFYYEKVLSVSEGGEGDKGGEGKGVLTKKQAFIDGGVLMNFPLNLCLSAGHDPREVLAIRRINAKEDNEEVFHPKSTLFELSFSLILKLIAKIEEPVVIQEIGYHIDIENSIYNLYSYIYNCIYSEDARKTLIEMGVRCVHPPLPTVESEDIDKGLVEEKVLTEEKV
jgi:predicted acylesterase/phospholipase RssA